MTHIEILLQGVKEEVARLTDENNELRAKLMRLERSHVRPVLTMLFTSLARADLFTWQEQVFAERGAALAVDTWEFTNFQGEQSLYACTLVYWASYDARD